MQALVLDTETTGLLSSHLMDLKRQPEVIEFSGLTLNLATGEQLGQYSTLINPKLPLPEEIIDITHITPEMLAAAPRFPAVADTIKQLIEAAPVVIAHNASFDKEMLDLEYERLGQKLNWPFTLCTVEQTVYLVGHRLSMAALYKWLFNETFKDAHRAEVDVKALGRCCIELHRRAIL
jgi:DNA polymerase-3 subunit epsilon